MGRIVKDTKSETDRRPVVMPPEAMRAITDHLEDYEWADTGEIVTGPTGRPARRASVSDAWKAAKKAAGPARPSPPRGDADGPNAGHHHQGAYGPGTHRPRCTDVSARNRGARPGNSYLHE